MVVSILVAARRGCDWLLDRNDRWPKAVRMRTIPSSDFLACPEPPLLREDEIHVWLFPDWPDSRDSAASPLVRRWLAGYDGRNASELRVDRREDGKPFLVDSTLQFNLSHSRGALLLALARDTPVGVDLENPERQPRALDLADRWFHPSEVAALTALDEPMRASAFLRLWCCKEAVLKATGSGIANGLAQAVFRLDSDGRVVGFGDANSIGGYGLVQLEPAVGLMGALAWRGGNKPVKVFRYAQ
jgi:4'-phosphopantetheinyl transferase